jgi:hypothetical protein
LSALYDQHGTTTTTTMNTTTTAITNTTTTNISTRVMCAIHGGIAEIY